jgi:hypothetical protein
MKTPGSFFMGTGMIEKLQLLPYDLAFISHQIIGFLDNLFVSVHLLALAGDMGYQLSRPVKGQ